MWPRHVMRTGVAEQNNLEIVFFLVVIHVGASGQIGHALQGRRIAFDQISIFAVKMVCLLLNIPDCVQRNNRGVKYL